MDMQLPTLKRVYAISKNNRIEAYASCVSGGPPPLWGVWSTSGKFIRYFASRADVEAAWAKAKFEPTYIAYAEGELFTERKQALRAIGVSWVNVSPFAMDQDSGAIAGVVH